MKSHQDLHVWKKSLELVLTIYKITKSFPREESFCLTIQLRRAAISVISNISEGAARDQKKEFIRFLRISSGSLAEIESQLIVACHLSYLGDMEMNDICKIIYLIRAQLTGLIHNLEKKIS